MYELFDENGNLILKGSRKQVIGKLESLPVDQFVEIRKVSDGEQVVEGFPPECLVALLD